VCRFWDHTHTLFHQNQHFYCANLPKNEKRWTLFAQLGNKLHKKDLFWNSIPGVFLCQSLHTFPFKLLHMIYVKINVYVFRLFDLSGAKKCVFVERKWNLKYRYYVRKWPIKNVYKSERANTCTSEMKYKKYVLMTKWTGK
jgi:hypothetical protein